MGTTIVMPEMGEGIIEATVAQWLKGEGEPVEALEAVLEVETDKVTTELVAEESGTLLKIYTPAGEMVPVGTLLAFIGEVGEALPDAAGETAVAPPVTTAVTPDASPAPAKLDNGRVPDQGYTGRISPVVARIAAEHSINLDHVPGTGRDGRITKKDILAYIDSGARPSAAPPPPAPAGPRRVLGAGELLPLNNMRRAIAAHMVGSKQTSPHVMTLFEFDLTAVAAHRAAHKAQFARDGARLTYTAYFAAATVAALKQHPLVNSMWQADGIWLHRDVNLGLATALEEGLLVPVIKQAESLNLLGLARAINDLADRAREKKLRPEETQGGTFTITNHGVSGSILAMPIINQPQAGILGVGKIEKRVKVINDAIAIRPMAYVSFTFDHRILDGATADYFVATIKEMIEQWPDGAAGP